MRSFAMLIILAIPSWMFADAADVEKLIGILKTGKPTEQAKAAQSLKAIGEDAKPALRELCKAATAKSADVQQASLEAIEKLAPELHKHAIVLVVDTKFRGHGKAILGLGNLKEAGKPAVPIVLNYIDRVLFAIQDPKLSAETGDTPRFGQIGYALSEIGADDPDAVSRIMSMARLPEKKTPVGLRNFYLTNRDSVLGTLGSMAEKNPAIRKDAATVIISVFPELSKGHQPAAILAIGKLGADGREAAPLLRKLKADPDGLIRKLATEALGKVEP